MLVNKRKKRGDSNWEFGFWNWGRILCFKLFKNKFNFVLLVLGNGKYFAIDSTKNTNKINSHPPKNLIHKTLKICVKDYQNQPTFFKENSIKIGTFADIRNLLLWMILQ